MTNEMLADLIQKGDNDELIPVLWDKMKGLLYKKAGEAYNRYESRCIQCGVELSDIRQSCFPVLLDAVRGYKPDKGLMLTAYVNHPFRNMFRQLLGLRTERQKNEPLNSCASLDEPLEGSDGDACTRLDIIPAADSTAFIDRLEASDDAGTVRRAVEELPELLRNVVQWYFFENAGLSAIGERLGVSAERARQMKAKALRELRKNTQLRQLWEETVQHTRWVGVSRFQSSPEYFEICRAAKEKPLSYGYRQAELHHAFVQWQKNADRDSC